MGTFHHHSYTSCLGEIMTEDDGSGHSPIYGWMNDGFPVYGPYNGNKVLAQSCWSKRDYSKSSVTGCSDGQRSCQLVNQYDKSKGTKTVKAGPDVDGTTSTRSGNTISAASGIYYEDFYYESTCYAKGGAYLDQHNGHDHDGLGYHYHTTIDSSAKPVFPYIIGPTLYGCVGCTSGAPKCGTSAGIDPSSSSCLKATAPRQDNGNQEGTSRVQRNLE